MKHILDIDDLDQELIERVFKRAEEMKWLRLGKGAPTRFFRDLGGLLRGKLMIADFFEPSTRTRFSFEAAMAYLGGMVIGSENAAEFSSFKKGESLEDNFRVISGYGDIIVGRFLNEGDARRAAAVSEIPLINGGDGKGEHPTQALIDLFSIRERFPKLFARDSAPIKIMFFGDNSRSRTVHSLARLLARYSAVGEIVFVSPPHLRPDVAFVSEIDDRASRRLACVWSFDDRKLGRLWHKTNVVYVTRSQDERGGVVQPGIVFYPEYLDCLSPDAIILHPLPRNSELPTAIDSDPRAYYFEQTKNGLFVRMALLELLLPNWR